MHVAGTAIPIERLSAIGVQVGGNLALEDSLAETSDFRGSVIAGSLDLKGGGKVTLDRSRVASSITIDGATTPIEQLSAVGIKVGGDLTVVGTLAGAVDFSGSAIDGDVVLGDLLPLELTSLNGSDPELRLADVRVGRDSQGEAGHHWNPSHDRLGQKAASHPTFPLAIYPGWLLGEALFHPTSGLAWRSSPSCIARRISGSQSSMDETFPWTDSAMSC